VCVCAVCVCAVCALCVSAVCAFRSPAAWPCARWLAGSASGARMR
jgi:hypothetical protein